MGRLQGPPRDPGKPRQKDRRLYLRQEYVRSGLGHCTRRWLRDREFLRGLVKIHTADPGRGKKDAERLQRGQTTGYGLHHARLREQRCPDNR